MRCRRVLSYLSAYCRGELTGRRQRAVKEHLNDCPECRREEAVFWEINKSIRNLPERKVSGDFNSKLLDRIAKERFRETRTKAYLPKRAPIFGQGKLIPAFVSVGLVLAFVMFGGVNFMSTPDQPQNVYTNGSTSSELDNSYATVQPESTYQKPKASFAAHTQQAWTFKQKLAQANRMRALMNRLAGQNSFGSRYPHSLDNQLVPASQTFILQRPVGNTQNRMVSGN
jgi:hypothetical protein